MELKDLSQTSTESNSNRLDNMISQFDDLTEAYAKAKRYLIRYQKTHSAMDLVHVHFFLTHLAEYGLNLAADLQPEVESWIGPELN